MTQLVETKISVELKSAKQGAILHDGWSCGGVHYVGLFASYVRTIVTSNAKQSCDLHEIVELVLLSCFPMAQAEPYDTDETERDDRGREAIEFTAATHAEHIREMFRFYDIDSHQWIVCQIADNCRVNKKVARLLQIPHVACKSHLLNLEVNYMVKLTPEMARVLESIHDTMTQCKQRLRKIALLRNIVDFRPVLYNKTRWSGKYYMLERFLAIREELIEVCDDERSDLSVNRSSGFKSKVERCCKQLEQIDLVTKELQTRKPSLSHCQNALDSLVSEVQYGFHQSDSAFYSCFLKDQYIGPNAEILADCFFERGVCKIQEGRTAALKEHERQACIRLLLPVEDSDSETTVNQNFVVQYKERLNRHKRGKLLSESRYVNSDFILGSVAEVKRLCSVANYILSDSRSRTTPEVFESIVFLRVHARIWDEELVKKAFGLVT